MSAPSHRVWDPLYGRIELSDFEYELALSPELQRLRHIRMCNINSLLLTGASEISRFEHSVGVLRLAQEWVLNHPLSCTDRTVLLAAALLHDVQSGPFGHSLQYVLQSTLGKDAFRHQDIRHGSSRGYYQDLAANSVFAGQPFQAERLLGDQWEAVADAILGRGYLGPLVSGPLDLDNLDNVVRLGYHAGICSQDDATLALRLVRDLDLHDGGLSVTSKSIQLIERWQEIRKRLYDLLLHDWADFAAKAMLAKALNLAVRLELLGEDSWLMTDGDLLRYLQETATGEAQAISEIVRRLRRGDLYQPVYLGCTQSDGSRITFNTYAIGEDFQREITQYADSELHLHTDLIVHLIHDRGTSARSVPVFVRDENRADIIGRTSDQLLVGVFVARPIDSERKTQRLRDRALHIMGSRGFQLQPLADPTGAAGAPSPVVAEPRLL